MGIAIGVLVATAAWFALRRAGVRQAAALQLTAAALLLGLAGYTLQGRPDLAGAPAGERPQKALPPVLPVELAGTFYGRFNAATPWIIIANGYMGRGDTANALATLNSGVRAAPRNSELWIALGNALIAHNGGRSSPASELAYQQSMALAPQHPAPRFFYGLALLQQGQAEQGLALWKEVLRDAPATASWRPDLLARVQVVESLMKRNAPQKGASPSG